MSLLNCFLCTTLLLLGSTLPLQGADRLPASQIMTPQDMRSMGFDKLSPEEKAAFERWAASWTQHVIEQAPTYRPGQNLSMWVQSWPSYANPTKSQYSPEEIQMRQQSNQVIDRIRDNGEYIDLKDGSSWHISPFYRFLTSTWQKNQVLEVQQGENDLHPWLLHNLLLDQVAEADMVKSSSPTGKKDHEPPEYYRGSVLLQSVTAAGDIVTLADGSIWKIAPTDMYKAKNWSKSDRILVEESDNYLYNYRLTNLDTGEVALANPPKR